MTIVMRMKGVGVEQVRFGFVEAQEMLHSLLVLHKPKWHPLHIQWIMRTRKRLSPGLKAELEGLREIWKNGLPVFWDVREAEFGSSMEEQLGELRKRDRDLFVKDMLQATYEQSMKKRGLEAAPDLVSLAKHMPLLEEELGEGAAIYRRLLEEPEQVKERLTELLGAYWESCLEREWPEIEEMMAGDIERRARVMQEKGVLQGLVNLSRYLHVNVQSGVCVIPYNTLKTDVSLGAESELFLMPSYFTWPYLLVDAQLPRPLLSYPLMQQQSEGGLPVPPERLLELLKATGDVSRLQILQLLRVKPRSTRELAGIVRLAEATVSKHLKLLQSAGVVEPFRESHYVFYRLKRGALRELVQGVSTTFEV